MKVLLLGLTTMIAMAVSLKGNYFELHTTDAWVYTYFPWSGPSLCFKVKAHNDVHVIFAKTNNPNLTGHQFFEVVIGGWSNRQSVCREEHLVGEGPYTHVRTQTPEIVSDQEYRGFWITIKDHCFSLGREGESCPIMVWNNPDPFDKYSYFGLSTGFGSFGDWIVYDDQKKCAPVCGP